MKPYYGVGRENVLWDVNTTSSFVFFVSVTRSSPIVIDIWTRHPLIEHNDFSRHDFENTSSLTAMFLHFV